MSHPSATASIKIEVRPSVASSVAISRPSGGYTPSGASPSSASLGAPSSIAASVPLGGTGAGAAILPTIFSLPLGGAGAGGLNAQTTQHTLNSVATAGLHASPKMSLTQPQILPPPQLQQHSGGTQSSAAVNSRPLTSSFVSPSGGLQASSVLGSLGMSAGSLASIGAVSTGGGSGSLHITGGGSSGTQSSASGPSPSPSAGAPAPAWQCSHSLLFVGNTRSPEDLVATQITVQNRISRYLGHSSPLNCICHVFV
jgi:hypothetical protein